MNFSKTFIHLFIFFLLIYNIFLLLLLTNIRIDISFGQASLNSTNSGTAKSKNFDIRVGQGNTSVSYNQYYPSNIEIVKGDSITWYSGIDMPMPHTVTFLLGLDNTEKIAIPFYIPNTTKFVSSIENTREPLKEADKNGTETIMVLNSSPKSYYYYK